MLGPLIIILVAFCFQINNLILRLNKSLISRLHKMYAENFLYSEYFDSQDFNTQFQFITPKTYHQSELETSPKVASSFVCEELFSNDIKEGMFALHGHFLVYYRVKHHLILSLIFFF